MGNILLYIDAWREWYGGHKEKKENRQEDSNGDNLAKYLISKHLFRLNEDSNFLCFLLFVYHFISPLSPSFSLQVASLSFHWYFSLSSLSFSCFSSSTFLLSFPPLCLIFSSYVVISSFFFKAANSPILVFLSQRLSSYRFCLSSTFTSSSSPSLSPVLKLWSLETLPPPTLYMYVYMHVETHYTTRDRLHPCHDTK